MRHKLLFIILACLFPIAGSAAPAAGWGNAFEQDTFHTKSGKPVVITFIKHATLMLTLDGRSVQVDPLMQYADYSAAADADMILLTHEHGDHLDSKAIEELTKPETVIIGSNACCQRLGRGKELKNGDKYEHFGIAVAAVPAYNTTAGRESFHPKGHGNGYVITFDGFKIYIAGDTEDVPELAALKDIDVAFLPVNQPNTMTVRQAVGAAKLFKPKVLYPYHYKSTNVSEIATELAGSGVEVRIRFNK